MSIERRFLGWDRPALHLAVDFLHDEYRKGFQWDLSSVAVALTGARAGRRLRELLAIRAAKLSSAGENVILVPPRILTIGDLPELFSTTPIPHATEIEALLAWAEALRRLPNPALSHIFPGAGDPDPATLYALAGEASAIYREVASECISCADLAAYCKTGGYAAGAARWKAFAQAERLFHEVLAEEGRVSRDRARIDALEKKLSSDRTVIVVAGADLPTITRRTLGAAQSPVVALVHAPESEQAGFDETGAFDTDYWESAKIPLPDEGLTIADFPRDEALAVAETLTSLPDLPPGMVTVTVCEESLGGSIERAVELAGKRARRAAGQKLSSSPPAQLLTLLAAYLPEHRAEHFAALIRHPDINDWLARTLGWPNPAGPWPDLCDQFIAERLPVTIDREAKKMPAELARATQAIHDLLGTDPNSRQPLPACVARIAEILAQVYKRDHSAEHTVPPLPAELRASFGGALNSVTAGEGLGVRVMSGEGPGVRVSLDLLVDALRGLVESSQRDGLKLTFTEAVGFLLATSGDQPVPAQAGEPQIDMIGWLETHLDDAPVLILAGMNEGAVPQRVPSDAFLPDSLRSDLGLLDSRRRYARDAYLFSAILASRQFTRVICARYGDQNEPLAPSRLVLACPAEGVVRRVLSFYGRDAQEEARTDATNPAVSSLAAIPRPKRRAKPISRLSVSAFRDYLACPYRFYLKHVLGLKTVDDSYVEMRPDDFGDLLHKVLQDFGKWVREQKEGRPPVDPTAISRFLRDSLERRARARFGETMHPAVAIQVELLGRRLAAFARFQAAEADSGWIILATERPLRAELDIEGEPFLICGRIDRIDYHPAHGIYRILDYKSRDGGCDPETSHRNSQGWTDLQLPLYKRLAALIDIGREIGPDAVEVGYIALPKDVKKIGYAPAPWTEEEFREADFLADEIVGKVRAEEFWPPKLTPPVFDDGLGAICLDRALDRQAVIELDAGAEAVWPDPVSVEEMSYES